MPNFVDEAIQKANALTSVMEKYSTELAEAGYDETERNSFKLAVADVLAKDTAQKTAMELVRQKTAAQNGAMNNALGHIRASQNAARAAYGEDNSTILKEFHVGKEKITTVKIMVTELAYMKEVAVKHQTNLAKNGFSANDIALFATLIQNLTTADVEQENAKKFQVSATSVRDKAAEDLQKQIKRIRNIAKAKFKKNEEILNEFSSITVKRTSAKEETPATLQQTDVKK